MEKEQLQTFKRPLSLFFTEHYKRLIKKLNFEFMDLEMMPRSLRATLRDLLEVGNNSPFGGYYQWASASIYEYAQKNNIKEIVELGAGCAPITRKLIKKYPQWKVNFKITDINPDRINFKSLENSDQRVTAIYEPLDFTIKINGYENSLLILSAAFHHVEENKKKTILSSLKALSPHVMIFEPLKPDLPSKLIVAGGFFSGLLTPLFRINSTIFFRCFLWCWIIPIAPLMFWWDGLISAFRCWSKQKWQAQEPKSKIEESLFCTKIILTR